VRDDHVQVWRYQLSLFSISCRRKANAGAASAVVHGFAPVGAGRPDREAALANVATPDVLFKDSIQRRWRVPDLVIHLAPRTFCPSCPASRRTPPLSGHVLAGGWRETRMVKRARGTNVFPVRPRGLFESVTGFWSAHPRRICHDCSAGDCSTQAAAVAGARTTIEYDLPHDAGRPSMQPATTAPTR